MLFYIHSFNALETGNPLRALLLNDGYAWDPAHRTLEDIPAAARLPLPPGDLDEEGWRFPAVPESAGEAWGAVIYSEDGGAGRLFMYTGQEAQHDVLPVGFPCRPNGGDIVLVRPLFQPSRV